MKMVLLSCIMLASLPGCSRNTRGASRYGADLNAKRYSIGLPPVDPNWPCCVMRATCVWENPQKRALLTAQGTAFYGEKRVHYKDGVPLAEEDFFYSGRKVSPRDPDATIMSDECLLVKYDYLAAEKGENPWMWSVFGGKEGGDGGGDDIEEARAILLSWGLSYPSPGRGN